MVNTDGRPTIANGAGDSWDGKPSSTRALLKKTHDLTKAQARARTFSEIRLALEAAEEIRLALEAEGLLEDGR
jgi:hypothetical protein